MDYFIVGHLLEFIKPELPNCKYLLVGNNVTSDKFLNNDIVCNRLTYHLESFPSLCAFTGWYAIAKNNLNNNELVTVLEYDTVVSAKFHSQLNGFIQHLNINNNYIIAYNKTITNHYVFTKSTPWLEISLQHIYDINLKLFVSKYSKNFPVWPTSTNITMPFDVLCQFVNWFEPMTKLFRDDPLGAYVHERAFFIFCILYDIKIIYLDNLLHHNQKCSHNIKDIYGTMLSKHNTTILQEHMKPEYDMMYDKAVRVALQSLR